MSLLRARSRDNEGVASAAGCTPDRPGRVDSFCGLVANFYSLEIENSCWEVGIRRLVRVLQCE